MKNKHRIVGLLLLGILFLNFTLVSILTTAELVNDRDNDGVDDNYEEINKRIIEVDIFEDETRARIISLKETNQSRDQIVVDIELSEDGIEIYFMYKSNLDYEHILIFGIVFHEIIEYNDTNQDNTFNPEIDQVVQNFSINTFYTMFYSDSEENSLHHIRISSVNEIFNIYLTLAEEFALVEDQLITPAEMKIDIEISNFNFSLEDSRLGLYTKLISEGDFMTEEETEDELKGYATNETGLNTTVNDYTGFFTWNNYATIDEDQSVVYVSDIMEDHEKIYDQKLYFNYLHGNNIYHDPKVGIKGILVPLPTTPDPSNPTLLIVLILTIGSVSAAALYSVYHYGTNKISSSNTKKDRERYFQERFEESEVHEPYTEKPPLQILLEENSIEKLLQIKNLNITVISEDFFEIINRFEWEGNDRGDFIKEMLAITPAERQLILGEMVQNSSTISK